MQSQRLTAHITGQVHGVFYRAETQEKALELGLVGYVKNVSDGVEVVAEGPIEKLEEFEKFLWHASPYAKVENVESTRYKPTGRFSQFGIKFDLI